jgi:hypothetical protein
MFLGNMGLKGPHRALTRARTRTMTRDPVLGPGPKGPYQTKTTPIQTSRVCLEPPKPAQNYLISNKKQKTIEYQTENNTNSSVQTGGEPSTWFPPSAEPATRKNQVCKSKPSE